MALSFIGKPISLISHSDVRYRGILAGIDPAASTIQLSKVYSMGTENRRPAQEFIPPVPDPYEYIIFRASEVKDLAVDQTVEPVRGRSVHDDPAVLGASQHPPPPQPAPQPAPLQTQPQPSSTAATTRAQRLHTATASLETVERALGDLRVSQPANGNGTHSGTGRRRGGGPPVPLKVPTTDFDFESSNLRFVKETHEDSDETSSDEDSNQAENSKAKSKQNGAYDPSKSFFDLLTPGPPPAPGAQGQGQGHGRGHPRSGAPGGHPGHSLARARREQERERNVATFGEPGPNRTGFARPGGAYGMGPSHPNARGGRPRGGPRGNGGRGGGRRPPPNANVGAIVPAVIGASSGVRV